MQPLRGRANQRTDHIEQNSIPGLANRWLSHVADEGHYLGALDIISGEPAVQWTAR